MKKRYQEFYVGGGILLVFGMMTLWITRSALGGAETEKPPPGTSGAPWMRPHPTPFLAEAEKLKGSYEHDYLWMADILNKVDLRKDPLDYRYDYFRKKLSDVKEGFGKLDPFDYPPDLPEELRPKGPQVEESKEALLARLLANYKRDIIATVEIRGVYILNGEKKVMMGFRGTRSVPFMTGFYREGDTIIPLEEIDVVPPGRLFRTPMPVFGTLRVDHIQSGFTTLKVGAYYAAEPQSIRWDYITCYRTQSQTYNCE